MHISLQIVSDFVYSHCQRVKASKNGTHFHARCPLCGDSKKNPSKKRFHVDYNDGNPGYHCFNCGRHGSFIELYAELKGLSPHEAAREIISFDNIPDILANKKSPEPQKELTISYMDYILDDCVGQSPSGYIQEQYYKRLKEFMKKRNIQNEKIYIAYKGDYKGRIILPIYENNHIVYFQGRSILENPTTKYLSPEAPKEKIILNKEKFDKDKYIIVVEGILDAHSVGDQGTTILGKSVSEDKVKEISTMTDKGIIFVFDNDKSGFEEKNKFLKTNFSKLYKFFFFPSHFSYKYEWIKDINELSVKHGSEIGNMYEFIVSNSYSWFDTTIRMRMGEKENANHKNRPRPGNNR